MDKIIEKEGPARKKKKKKKRKGRKNKMQNQFKNLHS